MTPEQNADLRDEVHKIKTVGRRSIIFDGWKGTRKATDFKFCTHTHRANRSNRPREIVQKVTMGVVRDS